MVAYTSIGPNSNFKREKPAISLAFIYLRRLKLITFIPVFAEEGIESKITCQNDKLC